MQPGQSVGWWGMPFQQILLSEGLFASQGVQEWGPGIWSLFPPAPFPAFWLPKLSKKQIIRWQDEFSVLCLHWDLPTGWWGSHFRITSGGTHCSSGVPRTPPHSLALAPPILRAFGWGLKGETPSSARDCCLDSLLHPPHSLHLPYSVLQ